MKITELGGNVMNKVKKMAVPILLAGTAMGAGSQAMADVPITRQSHDFLRIVDNSGAIQASLSRMASANAGVKSVAEKPVSPSLYRGGKPVSRPNCGIDPDRNWANERLPRAAIEDCFDNNTYNEIQEDLAHLIEQTAARSGFYSYTEPVTINGEDRYFQVGVFLRANQSYDKAKRIGINLTPSDSAKNIYAIYEQPISAPPIGYDMLMPGAGELIVYTMDGLDPDSGLKLIHTEVTDEFAVKHRSAGDYTDDEQTFYDRSGVVKAIKYLAQYMDEYSSQLAILDYGNPISTKLKKDPMDPLDEYGNYTMPAIPYIEIETPERWYSRNECTMDNVTYGQRNVTNLAVEYKRDRYIINGDADVARSVYTETTTGTYTDPETGETETYARNDAIQPESLIKTLEDIFDFEAFRGEDPVMLTTEHLNAYNYDYSKPISDFQNHITDPYNEYSTPPNNLFGIRQDDPFNNIDAEVYQDPDDVIDDSIIKVEYDVYKLVDEGYYTTRSRTETQTYTEDEEQCKIVDVDVVDENGNVTGTTEEEQCKMVTVTKTKDVTITEDGRYETTTSPWTYTNWVPPVYQKSTNTACIHNTQEENFCETYNCEQTAPEKDNDGYITDENVSQYQEESFYWTTGNWSGCDGACGVGTETRSVTCVSTLGGPANSENCKGPKPDSERLCQGTGENCSFEWKTSEWSECSEVCGGGIKTRAVYCQAPSGEKVNDSRCTGTRPNEQTICNSDACRYNWSVSNWSSCVSNASCQQTQYRTVCYGGFGKDGESRCYSYKVDNPTARSTGWLGNKRTTITGTRSDGFNGSHFVCTSSSTSNCSYQVGSGKEAYYVSGTRITTNRHGQQSRSVRCIRQNDGASVHLGFCGTDQKKTHRICTLSSTPGSCGRTRSNRDPGGNSGV